MRSSVISAAVLAFASSVVAQTVGFDPISSPTQDQQVANGTTLDIVWAPTPSGYDNDTISITLLQGSTAATLQLASGFIATNISNYLGKYSYTVPSNPQFATYGFKISLDFDPTIFQYSFPFHVTGGSSASASGSATSTVTQTVSPGPSYTSSSTASVLTVTNSSSIATTTAPSSTFASPSSNLTLSTSAILKTTTTSGAGKTASATGSSTSTAAPSSSSSAAMGNAVTGGLAAFGGLVLAFAM